MDKQNKVAQHLAKATIASKSAAKPPVPAAKPLTPVEKAEQSAAAAQKKANHFAVKATAAVQPPTQVAAPAKAPSAPAMKASHFAIATRVRMDRCLYTSRCCCALHFSLASQLGDFKTMPRLWSPHGHLAGLRGPGSAASS